MHGSLKVKFFASIASILVLSPIISAQKPAEPADQVAMGVAQPPKSMDKVAADKVVAKKPKLTPDQVMGNQILESAESQARGLEAPMRSYSLLQIAAAFAASDPAKARGLLQDAFSASVAIPDDSFTRDFLQQDIFRMLLPISQSDVEERLTQAESRARRQASDSIIARYAEKKQFDKAIDLVQQVTSLDEFPYPAAGRLLESLSPEMNAEKQTLFASAIASYRAHDHSTGATVGDGTFTDLVMRFGDKRAAQAGFGGDRPKFSARPAKATTNLRLQSADQAAQQLSIPTTTINCLPCCLSYGGWMKAARIA